MITQASASNTSKSAGFSLFSFLVMVLVLALVGFAGLKVYEMQQSVASIDDGTSVSQAVTVKDVPSVITSGNDLRDVEKTLNAVDVDADTDFSAIDADVNLF